QECAASASIDADPVTTAAIDFATPTRTLAPRATSTVLALSVPLERDRRASESRRSGSPSGGSSSAAGLRRRWLPSWRTAALWVRMAARPTGRSSAGRPRVAAVDSCPDQGNHLLLLREWREARGHAHAAEPERRYLQVLSEHA